MCGIAGILRFDDRSPDEAALARMRRCVAHRGPDGHGAVTGGPCGLAHTRLSVIDLLSGDQPMSIPARGGLGALSLVFNGEIYNHRGLRRLLVKRGHAFASSHADTEVLLHGYREWGSDLPKHVDGMFAFAIWDAGAGELFLCRDRAGQKPLFVHADRQQCIFGSLVSAVVAGAGRDAELKIDRQALAEYLTFGYTFERSLIADLVEIPAGHWMRLDRRGRSQTARYWQPAPLSRASTRLGAVDAVEELLRDSVAARLEADVPLGCFLSGGIDSSLIAALAQKQLSGHRLRTFSVAMPEARYDESGHARRVARHINSEHRCLVAEGEVERDLQRLVAMTGEPTGDSSILPTYWLSRAAREHVTVALSGDGGDELFAGYDRYRALRLLARHRWWLGHVPAGWIDHPEPRSRRHRLARLTRAAQQATPGRQYLDMIRLFTPQQLGRLGADTDPASDTPRRFPDEPDPAEAARRWDLHHYLPFDLLRKVDRASMAVALEVRCPLLDRQVVDLASHLPVGVLTPGGRMKGLLRQVAARHLPDAIVRRGKMGFALPLGEWMRSDLREMVRGRLLGHDHLDALGLRLRRVEQLIDEHTTGRADHTHRLFALLTLSMWLDWLRDPDAGEAADGAAEVPTAQQ
ncbi:MAG: asparagine synthase (glutamine-hydrolyzing) [Alphaproteobacteria bacterium]|jgi:asparagine synthase (glutamine-hydrolysing)|nr:asparagine synthase (glutamine-hydrolyzing) [Alphaproteobacteria bacterium]